MRVLAIALMCGAMLCFTGLDTSSKWLGPRLPALQIVWARYLSATLIAVAVARPWAHPAALTSKRPGLQAIRSLLLLGSTVSVVLALRRLQLAETATISFLTPIFVALLAGRLLGERVGGERMIAIVVGFFGVLIATQPGTSAFQPIVLPRHRRRRLQFRLCVGDPQACGIRLAPDHACLDPGGRPRSFDADPAVGLAAARIAPCLAGHGGPRRIRRRGSRAPDRRPQVPAPTLTPFSYTQLVWMIASGFLVFGDWPPAATLIGAALVVACGAWLAVRESRGSRSPVVASAKAN